MFKSYLYLEHLMPKDSHHHHHHHHHHHVVPLARISLTPPYCSLPLAGLPGYIQYHHWAAVCMLHPVSSLSCCMYVRSRRPAFARPNEGVNRSTSFMSSSLFLQQYPACLVCLTLIVFVQLLFCWVLSPRLVQYCSQHSRVIAFKLLHTFC